MSPPGLGRRSVIFDVVVDVAVPLVLLVGVYFLLAGHNRPGGGFIGGLVAGAALVLRFLSGRPAFPTHRQPDPLVLMGLGVALAGLTAVGSWLWGLPLLDSSKVVLDLPWFGEVKAYSVLAFDTGVFLVVVGMVAAELDVLGHDDDDEPDGGPVPGDLDHIGETASGAGAGVDDEEVEA